jgi:hypothetical protein
MKKLVMMKNRKNLMMKTDQDHNNIKTRQGLKAPVQNPANSSLMHKIFY